MPEEQILDSNGAATEKSALALIGLVMSTEFWCELNNCNNLWTGEIIKNAASKYYGVWIELTDLLTLTTEGSTIAITNKEERTTATAISITMTILSTTSTSTATTTITTTTTKYSRSNNCETDRLAKGLTIMPVFVFDLRTSLR